MFGILSRGVAAFVASVSGSASNKSEDDSVANSSPGSLDERQSQSSNGCRKSPDGKSMSRQRYTIEKALLQDVDEMVQYLVDNFVPVEAILASLHIEQQDDIRIMLSDLVRDCVQCSSTCLVRCPSSGQIDGLCLASKATNFDMQIDRLCSYEFKDEQCSTAVEFLKYVFNRLDITYHFDEQKIMKPIFVAIVSVRKDKWDNGMAGAMLDSCLNAAKEDKCDGAIALASNTRACKLMAKRFPITLQSIRYNSFRGQYRYPPIVMEKDEPQRGLYVMLSKF